MDANDFEVSVRWDSDADGQFCEAVAKTKRAGRVLARATHRASTTTQDFFDAFGETGKQAIEEEVRTAAERIALRMP